MELRIFAIINATVVSDGITDTILIELDKPSPHGEKTVTARISAPSGHGVAWCKNHLHIDVKFKEG